MTPQSNTPWWLTGSGERRDYMHSPGVRTPEDRAMPVMVVRGLREGPTFLTLAGVHGDEYESMAAVRQIFTELDPESLSGTWVAVGCCNIDAYLAGNRVGSADGQDLARVFPGRPDGTLTEQIAHGLTHDFIRHASFLCDLHSAGRSSRMALLAGYSLGKEELTEVQREAARAFGLPLVWGTPPNEGRTLSAAYDLGVPSIYCEATGAGGCRREDVEAYVGGIRNVMVHLSMLDGQIHPPAGQRVVEDLTPNAGNLQVQNATPVDGLFRPAVDIHDQVSTGDLLGDVVDLSGRICFECRAQKSGMVVLIRHLPRVEAGTALAVVI